MAESFQVADQVFRERYFRELLREQNGNVARVAERARLSRTHVHAILRQLEIDPDEYRKGKGRKR